jgi:G:T-mismatch repair DNA endonuclease (very short patch repair protein)
LSNRGYWVQKISRNRTRDLQVNRDLRHAGWLVIRIWEHSLKTPRLKKWWVTRITNQFNRRVRFQGTVPGRT